MKFKIWKQFLKIFLLFSFSLTHSLLTSMPFSPGDPSGPGSPGSPFCPYSKKYTVLPSRKPCSSKSQVKVAAKLNWHRDSIDLLVGQVSRDVLSLPADRQRACVNPTKHTVYDMVTPLCSQLYHIHHLNAFHCYASPHRNEFGKIYHIANFMRQHVPHKYILC